MLGTQSSQLVQEVVQELMHRIRSTGSIFLLLDENNLALETLADFEKVEFQLAKGLNKRRDNTQETSSEFFCFIQGMLQRRSARMFRFIEKLNSCLIQFFEVLQIQCSNLSVHFTDGESHGECERAVTFSAEGKTYIIKFRDPRPYLVVKKVTEHLRNVTDINVVPPEIWCCPNHTWHVIRFLRETANHLNTNETALFMRRLGALTAVAYFLEMTDLHFDNIITWNYTPIIVDAECIFYSYAEYDRYSPTDRLTNTGLVSAAPFLSSILGGKSSALAFGARTTNGEIIYLAVDPGLDKNRLLDELGIAIDPAGFGEVVADGFYDAICALCATKKELLAEIKSISHGMKTRILLKLTMQYAVTLEMLRHPEHAGNIEGIGRIVSIFSKSRGVSVASNNETLRCEILDLLDSDVPFFWIEDCKGVPNIMHWTGPVKKLELQDSLDSRIERSLSSCNVSDAIRLRDELENFVSGRNRVSSN